MSNLGRTFLVTALALGMSSTAVFAQEASSASPASGPNSAQQAPSGASSRNDSAAVKPGDPNCIRDTGSRILPKPGHCLPVAGRSYTGKELRQTGQIDMGRALQMLDPSITRGQ